jgi:hypothetical protein
MKRFKKVVEVVTVPSARDKEEDIFPSERVLTVV